ncbi:hypothetical protein CRG98_027075 [Punica granatum]|uniref:Uncharacterized protein n=1 Tax=Punica granatum TaxID=22663 RepID=A0A2I0J907_PUNGR|nr:hypothetical protein CRG98_027075 [Punica granatum]
MAAAESSDMIGFFTSSVSLPTRLLRYLQIAMVALAKFVPLAMAGSSAPAQTSWRLWEQETESGVSWREIGAIAGDR